MDRGRPPIFNGASISNLRSNRASTFSQQPIGTPRRQEVPVLTTPSESSQPPRPNQGQPLTNDSKMMPPPPRRIPGILQIQVPSAQLQCIEEGQKVAHHRPSFTHNESGLEVRPLRLTRSQPQTSAYQTGEISVTPGNIVPPPRHDSQNDAGDLRLQAEESSATQQQDSQYDRGTFKYQMDEVNTAQNKGFQHQMDEISTAQNPGCVLGTTKEPANQRDESNIHPLLRNLPLNMDIVPDPLFGQRQLLQMLRSRERQRQSGNPQVQDGESQIPSLSKEMDTSSSVLVEAYNKARDGSTNQLRAILESQKLKFAFALAWVDDCATRGCVGFVVGGRDLGPVIRKMKISRRGDRDTQDRGREG